MTESLDRRIADLERELAGLRRQKLTELQNQMATLQASIGGIIIGPGPQFSRRGRPPKNANGTITSLPPAGIGRKRRGRKRGKRIADEDALAALSSAVKSAGKDGISARQASQVSGIFYPRAITLMDRHFKKSGSGKWTRYTA